MPAVNTAVPAAPAADTMPRGPLMAIGALLLVTLVGVAAVRLSGADIREPDAAAVATRSLRFEDRPDGSVAVLDAVSGRQFHAIQGEAGFLRGALRFFNNVRRNPQARQRIMAMRKVFRANQDHLEAVALIARKPER